MINLHPLRHARLNLIALAVALICGLTLFGLFRNHGFDDSYITFRYAANLAAGQGFVYNPGERILSTTAPLYALLLAPAAALGLSLPLVGNLVSCLGYAFGGLALFQLGRTWKQPLAGVAAGLLYIGYPLWIGSIGGETGLYQGLVLWGFAATAMRRYNLAAAFLALATLVRSDGALAGLCAGLFIVIAAWQALPPEQRNLNGLLRSLPWPAATIYLLLVLPWLLFAWIYFGAPFPVTLEVKRLQGQVIGSRPYLPGLIGYLNGVWALPLYRPLLVLALIGIVTALWQRNWLLPIGWGLLYAFAYTALGVSGYSWYYTAPLTAILIAAGVGLATCSDWLARLHPRLGTVAALALMATMLSGEIWGLNYLYQRPDRRLEPYRVVGEWLEQNSTPEESVGALEVGIIGYHSRRPMVDFAGLINPDIATHYTSGGGYHDSARYAIRTYRPALVVIQEPDMPLAMISPNPEQCRRVFEHPGPRPETSLIVYRCH